MNIVTIDANNTVTSVSPVPVGLTALVREEITRVGALWDGHRFIAPSDAVQIETATGIVMTVLKGAWADEQPVDDGFEWVDIATGAAEIGMIRQGDGTFTAPPPPRDIAGEVAGHALALKVGIVNATRTDGLTDPVTPEGLAAIETRYRAFSDKMNAKRTLDQVLTDPEKATMTLILAGFEFFEAVDAAAAAILAAGDAADPIDTDARWPALPAA